LVTKNNPYDFTGFTKLKLEEDAPLARHCEMACKKITVFTSQKVAKEFYGMTAIRLRGYSID